MFRQQGIVALVLLFVSSALFAERIPGRYIVELTSAPAARAVPNRASLRGAAGAAHRTRLRGEQQQMRTRLAARGAAVTESVDTVANALFVTISDDQAAALAALPGVKRVIPMRTRYMLLDRAVGLTGITSAWSSIGGAEYGGMGMKIAIIDSGIDAAHPAFAGSSLTAPEGYPRTSQTADLAYTSGKIIVARSYVNLLSRDPDITTRDHVGHGTALAMIAAGGPVAAPLATMRGVANRAYLGVYKIFGTPGYNDGTTDEAILKAMDDAVSDGMDIINLSLGSDYAARLDEDPLAEAVEAATAAGVLCVVAAGNNGTDLNTMASPGTAPSAITVGATTNDRTFSASVEVAGLGAVLGLPGQGSAAYPASVTGALRDVAALDSTGLACATLPSGSLSGRIALILRGTCSFEAKLGYALAAGATGAVVYAQPDSPDPISMSVGAAALPAQMVSNADGEAIRAVLANDPAAVATLLFTANPVAIPPNRISSFSGAGPSVDLGIKPDLVAVGTDFYTATQSLNPNGDMYSTDGYILVDGTSFATPLVAGAAALLKSSRAGLSTDQYRSLLINTSGPVTGSSTVQHTGAGLLNLQGALQSTATATPVSLSFGAGGADLNATRSLHLANISGRPETYTFTVRPASGAAPVLSADSAEIDGGGALDLGVTWTAAGLAAGAYEGTIEVVGAATGTLLRIPYWYAVQSEVPKTVTVIDAYTSGRRGRTLADAILFRITDAAGLIVNSVTPTATVTAGNGRVATPVLYDTQIPGLWGLTVQLGSTAGTNTFRIQAGEATLEVSITGQ